MARSMTDHGGAASPRNEAGKRLLAYLFEPGKSDDLGLAGDDPQPWVTAILAIEAEAAQEAPAPEGLRAALAEPDAHPFRWMLDGTPCWCVSADEPHKGWVHAPACQALLRERLALALAVSQNCDALRAALERLDAVARVSDLTPVGEAELRAALDQSYWLLHPDQRPSVIDVAARADAERRARSAGGAAVGNRPDVATPRVAKATRGAKGAR